ncbi:N-acetyltransferase family protein [Azospirillum sp. sgz301742]
MPDVVVRPSRAEDIDAIHAIYAHHVLRGLASFEEVPPAAAELAQRREAILAGGLPYLVAEVNGRVAGYAYAGLFRTRSAYRYTLEDSVYVEPGREGQGIGRALLTRLLAECERLGCRRMIAVIGDSGNAGSIGLHAALGFQHAGVLPSTGFKLGRWVDTVMMQRPMGPGDETLPE